MESETCEIWKVSVKKKNTGYECTSKHGSDYLFRMTTDITILQNLKKLTVLDSCGWCNYCHKLGGLKQQKFILSQFWTEVQSEVVG